MGERKIIHFLLVLTVVHSACARIPEQNQLSVEDVLNSEKNFIDVSNIGYENHSQFNVMSSVKNEYYGTHINEPQSNKNYIVRPNVTSLCDCGGNNKDGNQDQDKATVGVKHNNTVLQVSLYSNNKAFLKSFDEARLKINEAVYLICGDDSPQRAHMQWVNPHGKLVTNTKGKNYWSHFGVLFVIRQTSDPDGDLSGTYTCQAPEFLGQPGSEKKVKISFD